MLLRHNKTQKYFPIVNYKIDEVIAHHHVYIKHHSAFVHCELRSLLIDRDN